MKLVLATAIVIAACSFPLAASESADAPSGAPQAAETEVEEKLICTAERKTGTRMPVRVCRTQAQINAEREQARDALVRGKRNLASPKSREGM